MKFAAQKFADLVAAKLGGLPGQITLEEYPDRVGFAIRRSFIADGVRYTQEHALPYGATDAASEEAAATCVASAMANAGLEHSAWVKNPVPHETLPENALRAILLDIARELDHPGLKNGYAFALRDLVSMVRKLKARAA